MLPGDRFAVLRRPRRLWAVAALHGEARALRDLHRQLEPALRPGDRLVYLGNLLGWTDGITAALDELLAFRARLIARPGAGACDVVYLRGAQEEMWQKLLQLQFAANPADVLRWMLDQGVGATIRAYGSEPEAGLKAASAGAVQLARWTNGLRAAVQAMPGHAALLGAVKRAAYADDRSALFVHAGLDPRESLAQQGDILWWGGGFSSIAEPYQGFKVVVRGYDRAHAGVQTAEFSATVDGGCGFGGPLLAACFDLDGRIIDLLEGNPRAAA
ncbi:MAG: hypothetical protein JNK11_13840 [Alphaproteobacteria bacterium]|nr:hypothetical protein [Alphaproteobacteria bacterium]